MSKHTAGPWNINRDESTSSCDPEKLSIEGGGLFIAQVDHCMHQEANAKLIAAAPCLLAALQAFERISDIWLPATASEEHEGEMTALHQARNEMLAAIEKATA